MENLAERYTDENVAFAFVYTREAHPGEQIPHHSSLTQKLEHARLFQERWSVRRDILVDELDGLIHRAYGTLPNMTYIVNSAGRIVYRADWSDAHSVEWVLEYLRHEASEKRTTRRVAPFFSELLGHRSAMDYPRVFVDGLLHGGGARAVEEYVEAIERRRGANQSDPMRRLWAEMQKG